MPHPENVFQISSYYCSFCGRSNMQVRYIITATPSINICNECVGMCNEIINKQQNVTEDKDANG